MGLKSGLLHRLLALGLFALLTSCGGGGGGGSSGSKPALIFTPSTLTANFRAGTFASVTVRATATDPGSYNGTLYVYIVDAKQVLAGTPSLSAVDSSTIAATLYTSASLAPGHYQGTFQVQLCRDVNCNSQYAGSPVPLPYDFTVTDFPLSAKPFLSTDVSMHSGGQAPEDLLVQVSGPAQSWTASSAVDWLKINKGAGQGAASFSVTYAPTGLAPGVYATSVIVKSADGQSVSIPFTLTILQSQFSMLSGVPTFTAVNGAPIPAQTMSFEIDNKVASSWSARVSAPWLNVTPLTGTTPSTMTLQPDPSIGPLPSATHLADIVLSASSIPNRTLTTQLNLIKPTLSTSSNVITLGGANGRDLSPQTVQLSLNTGTNAWRWNLSTLPQTIITSTPSGSVSQNGASLSLAPNPAVQAPGSTSTTVTVTSQVNGDVVSLPLTVNVNSDEHKLLASQWGIGFSSTPTGSNLTRSIAVSDNFGIALGWHATSDKPWLTVTPSGTSGTGATLAISANPASLPSGALSYATVTIASDTAGVKPATVQVGLWKDVTGASAMTKLALNYSTITADKIRPYIYATNGDANIDVYNAYTAQKVATLSSYIAQFKGLSVSPDGQFLYALDATMRQLILFDLNNMSLSNFMAVDMAPTAYGNVDAVFAVRTNGVDFAILNNGNAYSPYGPKGTVAQMVTPLGTVPSLIPLRGYVASSPDGRKLYQATGGNGFGVIGIWNIDFTAMAGGNFISSTLPAFAAVQSSVMAGDSAVSPDGSRYYGTIYGGNGCEVFDAASNTSLGRLPDGLLAATNVETTSDGRVICGGWASYSSNDVYVYSRDGILIASYRVSASHSLNDRQMVVTPDGFVLAALTTDPLLAFVAIGP
jgi:hypothetical protein